MVETGRREHIANDLRPLYRIRRGRRVKVGCKMSRKEEIKLLRSSSVRGREHNKFPVLGPPFL